MTEENRRQLTVLEASILNKLLSQDFPGRDRLKDQLSKSSAVPTQDNDNFGSIHLFTASRVKAQVKNRIPVEAVAKDEDGTPINILLHVVDGFINELEIFKTDGSKMVGPISPENLEVKVH